MLVEAVVLVWLAVLWFASGADPLVAVPSPAHGPAVAHGAAAVTAPLAPPPPPNPHDVATPAREAAVAAAANVSPGDAHGIVLSGTVRGPDGAPVASTVGVVRDGAYRDGMGGTPGTYAIAGLQPGEFKLTCRADGFVPHEQSVTLDERAFQQLDVTLERAFVVRVKLLGADGKPTHADLAQKTTWGMPYVVATEAPLTEDLPPTVSSRLIRFGLGEWKSYGGGTSTPEPKLWEQGYCGELRLRRAPPVFVSLLLRNTLLQGQRLEPGQHELLFTIEAADVLARHGTVKLRLVDGVTQAPIGGRMVTVRTAQGGGNHATTDAEGRIVLAGVVPGLGMLESDGGGDREDLFRYVRVPAGGSLDLGDVPVSATETIRGIVVGDDGQPVKGASVQCTELDCRTFPQPLVDFRSTGTDADGKFGLRGGRHRYVVFGRTRDGLLGFATVDARTGARGTATIVLGKPTKVTLNARCGPTDGYMVTALASDRSPIAVASMGADLRAQSMSLLPGDYTIEIHDMRTDRLVRSVALRVGTEPLAIDVP